MAIGTKVYYEVRHQNPNNYKQCATTLGEAEVVGETARQWLVRAFETHSMDCYWAHEYRIPKAALLNPSIDPILGKLKDRNDDRTSLKFWPAPELYNEYRRAVDRAEYERKWVSANMPKFLHRLKYEVSTKPVSVDVLRQVAALLGVETVEPT